MMFRLDGLGGCVGKQQKWPEVNYSGPRKKFHGRSARAVVVHRDAITGIDRIFGINSYSGVVSGVYDPRSDLPGKVVWDKQPKKIDLSSVGDGKATSLKHRPLSLVVANDKIFMSSGGWILQRTDGPNPVWKGIIDISKFRGGDGWVHEVGGIRGMTAVPSGPAHPPTPDHLFYRSHGSSVPILLMMDL